MDGSASDLNARLGARLRGLRAGRGLTLDELAERSGVSRSAISLIERGASSPTAAVLDRLAAAFGLTIAALFAEDERPDASPVGRRAAQATWRDPATGYERRNLSPPGYPSPLQLVEVVLPPGARVAYDNAYAAPDGGIAQQVWVLDGRLEVTVGEAVHALAEGDCLAMRLDRPTAFRNPGERAARYLVALAADGPPRAARRERERSGAWTAASG